MKPTTPETVLGTARLYFAAYCDVRTPHIITESSFLFYGAPAAVLGAFALELYLKCIAVIDGKRILQTHQPSKLFRALAPDRQSHMARAWSKQDPSVSHTASDVEGFLRALDPVFVAWRYPFEADLLKVDFDELDDALIAVQQTILEMRPDWFQEGLKLIVRQPAIGLMTSTATPFAIAYERSRR